MDDQHQSGPKRALVTGAGDRLGLAMAEALVEDGWDVAFHYNQSTSAARDAAERARHRGARTAALKGDFADADDIETLVPRAVDALGGPLSCLINNASTFGFDRIGKVTEVTWARGMDSNLRAPVMLTQAFAEQAPKAENDDHGEPVAQAVVVNMLDQRVLKTTPFFTSYTLAKSALLTFTRTAAQALAPHIRVAAIGPGPTLVAKGQSPDSFDRQRKACVLGRGSNPEDIVHAMRFVLSNKAYTGQMMAIDGGQHLAWQTPDVMGHFQ